MRIFIVPTEPHNTYFYKLASSAQISDDNYIEVRQNGSSITLEGEDVYKEIKRRVMVYSSIKNSDNL